MAAPTVTTQAATNITGTSATLNGTLEDNGGSETTVSFEYGLTNAYGSTTTDEIKTTGQTFSANVTGLTPGTLYHFRSKGGELMSVATYTASATGYDKLLGALGGNVTWAEHMAATGSGASDLCSVGWEYVPLTNSPDRWNTVNSNVVGFAVPEGLIPISAKIRLLCTVVDVASASWNTTTIGVYQGSPASYPIVAEDWDNAIDAGSVLITNTKTFADAVVDEWLEFDVLPGKLSYLTPVDGIVWVYIMDGNTASGTRPNMPALQYLSGYVRFGELGIGSPAELVITYYTNVAYGSDLTFTTLGSVYPSEAITRVTNIIHRYSKEGQVYTMELNLGGVTNELGIPEWADRPMYAITPKTEAPAPPNLFEPHIPDVPAPTPSPTPTPIPGQITCPYDGMTFDSYLDYGIHYALYHAWNI